MTMQHVSPLPSPLEEKTFVLSSEAETRHAGQVLANMLSAGMFVALWGDLGTGKTALVRAIIQSVNPDETEVPSPTFTLLQEYEGKNCRIFHFDLYRLSSSEEVYELGWEDARQGICLVEWPDRLGALLPSVRLDVRMNYHRTNQNARTMTLQATAEMIETFSDRFHKALQQKL